MNRLFSRDKLNFFRGGEGEKGLQRERARVKEARLIFIPDAAPEGTVFLLDAEGLGYRGGLSRRGEECAEVGERGRWAFEGMEREAKGVATPEESSKCFSTYPRRRRRRRRTVYRLGECAAVSVCPLFRSVRVTWKEQDERMADTVRSLNSFASSIREIIIWVYYYFRARSLNTTVKYVFDVVAEYDVRMKVDLQFLPSL